MSTPNSKKLQGKWSKKEVKSKSKKRRHRSSTPVRVNEDSMANVPDWPPGCLPTNFPACNHANDEEERHCWRKTEAKSPRLLNAMRQKSSSSRRNTQKAENDHNLIVQRKRAKPSTPTALATPPPPIHEEDAVAEMEEMIRQHYDGKKDAEGMPITLDWLVRKKQSTQARKKAKKEAKQKAAAAKDSEKQPATEKKEDLEAAKDSIFVGKGFTLRIQQPKEPGGLAVVHLDAKVEGVNKQSIVEQPQEATSKPSDIAPKHPEHKPNN
ncbi:hypothetical protein M3Y98_00793400 [Aphelenchoides besseyi]|nr:hypothetical protein M3Y98_00793400 [Aphelenchoides besseyi]